MVGIEGHPLMLSKPVYSAMVVIVQLVRRARWIKTCYLSHVIFASFQVLLPRFGMDGDVEYDPEEDWLDDNKGKDHMDYPDFFDAMFELADMWYVQQFEGLKPLTLNTVNQI